MPRVRRASFLPTLFFTGLFRTWAALTDLRRFPAAFADGRTSLARCRRLDAREDLNFLAAECLVEYDFL
ncbi:MAG: hypothetical protein M0Z81_06100 [Deltaproteobacteria bacterium]|nr:hypothetical protein [Deltaproteobacteria bacterium]